MTVQSTYNPPISAGDGITTAFPTTFPYQLATDLLVQTIVVATQVVTTLVQGVDYTVFPLVNTPVANGTVTLTTALPVGTDLQISRATPISQLTHWVPNDPNLSTANESAVDKLTLIDQESIHNLGRSIYLRPFDVDGSGAFDARGNRITNLGDPIVGSDAVNMESVLQYISNLLSIGSAVAPNEFSFVGDGSTTAFPMAGATIAAPTGYNVYIDGVYQAPTTDYTINLSTLPSPTINFVTAPHNTGNIQIRVLGYQVPFGGIGTGFDASIIISGIFNPARLGSGTASASTFLNGLNQWTNKLIGGNGDITSVTDTSAVANFFNNANASIRVGAGAGAQASYRFATSADGNPFAAAWVYDTSLKVIGWSGYATPLFGTFDTVLGNVTFGSGFYFINSSGRVGIGQPAPAYTLDVAGTVNATNYLGTADGSLITSGQVLPQFLAANLPFAGAFLRYDGQWALPPNGGGGGGGATTTTTASFVIAAVGSSQTVALTSATGSAVGQTIQISDGVTHTIIGQISALAGLNATVVTNAISAGAAGNTMASGASVQLSTLPGQATIQIGDSSHSVVPCTSITFDAGSITSLTNIDLTLRTTSGGHAELQANTNLNFVASDIHYPFGATLDGPIIISADTSRGGFVNHGTQGANTVLHYDGANKYLAFDLLTGANIAVNSLLPSNLLAINSAANTLVPSYDSASQQFKWIAPSALPSGGTTAQFLIGNGTYGNSILAAIGSTDAAHTTQQAFLKSFNDGVNQMASLYQAASGTPTYSNAWSMGGQLLVGSGIGGVQLTTQTAGALIDAIGLEGLWSPDVIRSDSGFRSNWGYWGRVVTFTAPAAAITCDTSVGNYYILQSFANNTTVTLQDDVAVPSNTAYKYAGELTVEIDAPGSFTVTWASASGAITWLAGSAPTLSTTGTNIVRFVRKQGVTGWLGYVEQGTASGYTDAQARTAVLQTAYLQNSSSITWAITGGTSAVPSIASGGITGSMIAANTIGPAKLAATGTPSSTTYYRGDGVWATPAGGGGSGALYQLSNQGSNLGTPTTFTTLNANAGFTFSQSGATATLTPDLTYLQYGILVAGTSPGNIGAIAAGSGVSFALTGSATPGGQTLTISSTGGGGGGSFSPATSYSWTASQAFGVVNNHTAPSSYVVPITGAGPHGGNFGASQLQGGIGPVRDPGTGNMAGLNVYIDNHGTGGADGSLQTILTWNRIYNPTHGISNGYHILDVIGNWNTTTSPGFYLNQVALTSIRQLNATGTSDAVWLVSLSPDSRYSSTPDLGGITHSFTQGTVRIGEINYQNSWANMAFFESRGGFGQPFATTIVCGLEMFANASTANPGANGLGPAYDVSYGLCIGPGGGDGSTPVRQPRHNLGLLIDQNSVIPGGYTMRLWGSHDNGNPTQYFIGTNGQQSAATNAPAAIIKMSGTAQTGIDFAGTAHDSTILTATNIGAPVITMADNQAIKFGSIWLRGLSGHLQYSTNGSSWTQLV